MEFHINSKGKIERSFKSVKEQWMYNTDFDQFKNIEDIDSAFALYVSKKNNSPHASLNGNTPVNVFMDDESSIRRVEAERLEKYSIILQSEKLPMMQRSDSIQKFSKQSRNT